MNATQKNTIVMLAFFVLIMSMAAYYSIVLQKKLQSPLSYPIETERLVREGQLTNLD